MNQDKNWFYLATGMTLFFSTYVAVDLFNKIHKRNIKHQKQEQLQQLRDQQNQQNGQKNNSKDKSSSQNKTPLTQQFINTDVMQIPEFELNEQTKNKRIYKIVVTGGPCAGKTTGLAYSSELLRNRGYNVYIVPEAATMIAQGGGMINLANYTQEQIIRFQTALMKLQINLENRFFEIALIDKSDKPSVILCDRGVMDGQAYMDESTWIALLDEMDQNVINLRDKRYDAVIHLVTAADGAEQFYNLDNVARYESDLETAIKVDKKTQKAWQGHPYWAIIDNSDIKFDDKIKRMGEAICHFIGEPTSITFFKKFLLKQNAYQYIPKNIAVESFIVEDTFLVSNSEKESTKRIRRRGKGDSFLYLIFEVKKEKGQEVELRRRITSRQYIDLLNSQRDTSKRSILKNRYAFILNNVYFAIDEYLPNNPEKHVQLIVQSEKSQKDINIPQFLKEQIVREISNQQEFLIESISDKNWSLSQSDKNLIYDN